MCSSDLSKELGKPSVEDAQTESLLSSRIPHSNHEQVARNDRGLKDSQKQSTNDQSGKIADETSDNQKDTPRNLA